MAINCNQIEQTALYLQQVFASCNTLSADDMDLLVDLIMAINSCGEGNLTQNNLYEKIDLGHYIVRDEDRRRDDRIEVVRKINELPTFNIAETRLVYFTIVKNPSYIFDDVFNYRRVEEHYVAILKGKGDYGLNGTQLVYTDLFLINPVQNQTLRNTAIINQITRENKVLSGAVNWIENLDFFSTDIEYIFSNNIYTAPARPLITLTPSDPVLDRIDVFAIDSSTNTLVVIEGTPSVSPQEPTVEFSTQIRVTAALIQGGASTPSNVSIEQIYNENTREPTEWTLSAFNTNQGTIAFNNTDNPSRGNIAIRITNAESDDGFKAINDTMLSFNDMTSLAFDLELSEKPKPFNIKIILSSSVDNNSNIATVIENGTYGLDNTATGYNTIVVPASAFVSYGTGNYDTLDFIINNPNPGSAFDMELAFIDDMRIYQGESPITGVTSWLQLTDTDNTYNNKAGFIPQVVAGEDRLKLVDPSTLFTIPDPLEIYSESGTLAGGDGRASIGDIDISSPPNIAGSGLLYTQNLMGANIFFIKSTLAELQFEDLNIKATNLSIEDSDGFGIGYSTPNNIFRFAKDNFGIIGQPNNGWINFQSDDAIIQATNNEDGIGISKVNLSAPDGVTVNSTNVASNKVTLKTTNLIADTEIEFPPKSGTVALLDDITPLEVYSESGTLTGFNATAAIGNITSSFSGKGVLFKQINSTEASLDFISDYTNIKGGNSNIFLTENSITLFNNDTNANGINITGSSFKLTNPTSEFIFTKGINNEAKLKFSDIDAQKTFNFPNKSGIIALTSDLAKTITPDTTLSVDMSNPFGNDCNMLLASDADNLDTFLPTGTGGYATILVNSASEPNVGNSAVKEVGATFIPNENMYLIIKDTPRGYRYFWSYDTVKPATSSDADTLEGASLSQLLRSDISTTKTAGDLRFNDGIKAIFGSTDESQISYNAGDWQFEMGDATNLTVRKTGNIMFTFQDDGDLYLKDLRGQGFRTSGVVAGNTLIGILGDHAGSGRSTQVVVDDGARTVSAGDVDLVSNGMRFIIDNTAGQFTMGDDTGVNGGTHISIDEPNGEIIINAANVNFNGIPTYADDTAAGTGGLTVGQVYKTATGELRIKL